MKLLKLDRTDLDDIQHGEAVSVVISAATEERAKQLANERAGPEGKIWHMVTKVTAELIGISSLEAEQIILRSWHYDEVA